MQKYKKKVLKIALNENLIIRCLPSLIKKNRARFIIISIKVMR